MSGHEGILLEKTTRRIKRGKCWLEFDDDIHGLSALHAPRLLHLPAVAAHRNLCPIGRHGCAVCHHATVGKIVQSGKERGELRIPFYSADDFERVLDLLLGADRS